MSVASLAKWVGTEYSMPFMAGLWKIPECQRGGRPSVSPTISERQAVLLG
jgi:hypothetical protein